MIRPGMLLRAYQLPCRPPSCLRLHRYPPSTSYRLFNHQTFLAQERRTSPQSLGSQTPLKTDSAENIKPEAIQKPPDAESDEAPKTDGLLTEQTVSNKEQRKADWAIMKEMVQYLWPKVNLENKSVFKESSLT